MVGNLCVPHEDCGRLLAPSVRVTLTIERMAHEFQVPGTFEPCPRWIYEEAAYCLNQERFIEIVQNNSGKKLVCGRGHNASADPKKLFIPAWEFAEGGTYHGVLPLELLPEQSRIIETRWKVPRDAPIHAITSARCIRCETPPYVLFGDYDTAELWAWLERYAPDLISAAHEQLKATRGADLSNWFSTIDTSLRTKIMQRLMKSALAIDHGVPKKVGNRVWMLLSAAERRFLQVSLLLRLCRRCNGEKSARLLPRDELERLFAETYYESVAAARADTPRWTLLSAVLDRTYSEEAVG
jgi:hypothetical protein